MFAKKKNKAELTFIAHGTRTIGELHFEGNALVAGEVQGKISSLANIEIDSDGLIDGKVRCLELKVSGYFKGQLTCNKLIITNTGTVDGEVCSQSMEIFEGGQFIGQRIKEESPQIETVATQFEPLETTTETH